MVGSVIGYAPFILKAAKYTHLHVHRVFKELLYLVMTFYAELDMPD